MRNAYLRFVMIAFVMLISFMVNAQERRAIKGKVLSQTDGGPIVAASVGLKNGTFGTIANENGDFILSFPEKYQKTDTLIFSAIGYSTEKISLESESLNVKSITVKLTPLINRLQEVEVKNLTVQELVDSIIRHNQQQMVSPAIQSGYYREFVFTNDTCTEFAEALAEYYVMKGEGEETKQFKINESRCKKTPEKKGDDLINISSKINPNIFMNYYNLSVFEKKIFADDKLQLYRYKFEKDTTNGGLIMVSILPKTGSEEYLYNIKFVLTEDFLIKSYSIRVADEYLKFEKGVNVLGIHFKENKFEATVDYQNTTNGNFLKYMKIDFGMYIAGKFLGLKLNQNTEQVSEFLVTDIKTADVAPFTRKERYSKGNICKNGNTLNEEGLSKNNFILPSQKDLNNIQTIKE